MKVIETRAAASAAAAFSSALPQLKGSQTFL